MSQQPGLPFDTPSVKGVDVSWIATLPGMEDVEEMAAEAERNEERPPCPAGCNRGLLGPFRYFWAFVTCDTCGGDGYAHDLGGSG